MDDILLLGIGRTMVELSAQKEQLHQALKQAQAEIVALKTPPPEIKV